MRKTVAALIAACALSAPASAKEAAARCDLGAADAASAGAGCQRAWMDRNLKLNDVF